MDSRLLWYLASRDHQMARQRQVALPPPAAGARIVPDAPPPPPTPAPQVFGEPGGYARQLAEERQTEASGIRAGAQERLDVAYLDRLEQWNRWALDEGRRRRRRRLVQGAGAVFVLAFLAYAPAGVDHTGHPMVAVLVTTWFLIVPGMLFAGWLAGRPPRPAARPVRVEPDAAVEADAAAARASIGAESERRVATVLASRRLAWHAIVHGARLGAGGDADHVLLGAHLVVVETKTGFGRVQLLPAGRVKAGGRVLPGAPIRQVRAQSDALARISGQPVRAILCVVDGTSPAVATHDGTWVCNLQALPACLVRAAGPSGLTRDQSITLARRLHEGQYA